MDAPVPCAIRTLEVLRHFAARDEVRVERREHYRVDDRESNSDIFSVDDRSTG
jgi:hypothetical protein